MGAGFLVSKTPKGAKCPQFQFLSSVAAFMSCQNVQIALSRRVIRWRALKDNVTVETVKHKSACISGVETANRH